MAHVQKDGKAVLLGAVDKKGFYSIRMRDDEAVVNPKAKIANVADTFPCVGHVAAAADCICCGNVQMPFAVPH